MFDDRTRDADRIDFLESIVTNQGLGNLAGNHHHWNGIHIGGCNACYRIGSAGSGSDQYYTRLSSCTCITICRMRSALLMAYEDMLHIILLIKSIINVQYGTTRVAKYVINTLCFKAFDNNFCAG